MKKTLKIVFGRRPSTYLNISKGVGLRLVHAQFKKDLIKKLFMFVEGQLKKEKKEEKRIGNAVVE